LSFDSSDPEPKPASTKELNASAVSNLGFSSLKFSIAYFLILGVYSTPSDRTLINYSEASLFASPKNPWGAVVIKDPINLKMFS